MTEPKNNITRPPVVVVMGHIDHGKSTLLDYIRKTKITEQETGGITQHVAAYEVELKNPSKTGVAKITFIDTPGHDAFTGIRARGAAIADIAILVVSAEDGVKPQTTEAWQAIETNKLPVIVAINKTDRPEANVNRTKQSLAENNIFLEGFGGNTPFVAISAKTGDGIPELLELILLQAELSELKNDPTAPASGFILESNLDARAGISATAVIKNGVLNGRDYLVTGNDLFRIKRLADFNGKSTDHIASSSPAQIIGFSKLPLAGDQFWAFADKKLAELKLTEISKSTKTKQNNQAPISEKEITLPLVLRADVSGSLEALEKELAKINEEKVGLKIVARGTGQITENDIKQAVASTNSIVLGFRVKTEKAAEGLAEKLGVTIKTFDLIYKLSEWLETEVVARRPKVVTEEMMGQAKILKIFNQDKGKQVIGGSVLEKEIAIGQNCKIIRRGAEIGRGKILNLEQQKTKVKKVEIGNQFGALVEAKIGLAVGDLLETVDLIER